jgi:hypothetical protein
MIKYKKRYAISRHGVALLADKFLPLFPYTAYMSRYDRPSHRVYMTFFSRRGWQVRFVEADLKTPLRRMFTFKDPEKIRELARRGEAMRTSEDREMLEYGIEVGRGGCYLRLTPEQYRKLRRGPEQTEANRI